MTNEWFVINDIEEFSDRARIIVYNNFGLWNADHPIDISIDSIKTSDQDDLDQVLSHQESVIIVKQTAKKQKNKKTKETRYIISEKIFAQIVEDLNARMVSNILNSLVNKGLIDSAYDSDSNDFIFWVKDENNFKKPETD